jgi:hypothetical protein
MSAQTNLMTTMKTILALCAAFMIGSLAGYGISNRYELVAFNGGPNQTLMAYRVDKLTGQMWGIYSHGAVKPLHELNLP